MNSDASANSRFNYPQATIQGCGIGLRIEHFEQIIEQKPPIPWLEIISDNYLQEGSPQRSSLCKIRHDYPITFHGVGLSLGSSEPLSQDYLNRLKTLKDQIQPAWVSDHLAWSSAKHIVTHDLLPLPFNESVVNHLVDRIQQVQDFLGEQFVVENASTYLQFESSDMSEWEFVNEVVSRSDCKLLLDVNNIYVNAYNHGFDPLDYLSHIPADRVVEMHLAGYEDRDTHFLDSHSRPVTEPVWELFRKTIQLVGDAPVLIEWDNDIPGLERLLQEAHKAETIKSETL